MPFLLPRAALVLALPAALLVSGCDTTDDPDDATADASLFVTSNPDGVANDAVVRLSPSLTGTAVTFGGLSGATSIQSVAFDGSGNAFLTADIGPLAGAVVYVPGLCSGEDGACTNASTTLGGGTRIVAGSSTGLVAPKGLVVAGGFVMVADVGASGVGAAVRVFPTSASGNVAPEFAITDLGAGTSPWDIAFDATAGRLYVATTNGLVLVYDNVLTTRGENGPTRTITPTEGGEQVSVNLHGIAYDRGRDLLIVSDVGSATDSADGQIFTIGSASTARGATAVRYRNSGSATRLGNPVDLVLASNGRVYVAEKSNDLVLRYDGLLSATGIANAAADVSTSVTKPESVTLVND